MVVKELFDDIDEVLVIARAIFEDNTDADSLDCWIKKYYAQLQQLKSSDVVKSDKMLYLDVDCDNDKYYGEVSGFVYNDVKAGKEEYYALGYMEADEYASLYVPEYTLIRYGKEVVAAEALREYGWNVYDASISCKDDFCEKVKEVLKTIKTGIFPVDNEYFDKCRKQFELYYEGETERMENWEKTKEYIKNNGNISLIAFQTWIETLNLVDITGKSLICECTHLVNPEVLKTTNSYIDARYVKMILDAYNQFSGGNYKSIEIGLKRN